MTDTDTRTLLERACAKAVDIMLTGDDVATVRQGTGHHVVTIRTVESEEREARTIQRREEHAENARADTERELSRVVDELAHVRETGAAELARASDDLVGAAAEVDALRAELARQTGIAVDHCARADAAERMVVDLGAIIKEAADDLDCEDKRHAATGDTYNTTYVTETLKRGIAALSSTEAVAGRWVSRNSSEWSNMCDSLALFDGHMARVTAERDAAIAARDEAVASCKEWGDSFDALYAECAAAERARDEVGIQLAAAQAEIARMRPVVDAALVVVVHYDDSEQPAWLTKHVEALREAIRVFRAVPGDALAPKITAALEASGIDTDNVKGVE